MAPVDHDGQLDGAGPAVMIITAGSFFAALGGVSAYAITIDMGGEHVGTVFSLMNMCGNIGASVCPVCIAWIVERTGHWDPVLFIFAAIYVAAAVSWLLLNPNGTVLVIPTAFVSDTTARERRDEWIKAGVFEALVDDLRMLLRLELGRAEDPSAVILDSRTLQSSPESGARAGYDGAKRRKGSKVHMAVDTLGNLLAIHVTPANEQDRSQVGELAKQVQDITGDSVEVAFVDAGYTGEQAEQDAAHEGIRLQVVKLPNAKLGFVLLPRRWVVERSFGWLARFRRLARDYERLPETLAALHFLAFAMLLASRFFALISAKSL